jgi:hypothetical protein
MNFAGFLAYGVLIMAFALAVHRGIRADVGGWLGPTVLALYGLAYIGVYPRLTKDPAWRSLAVATLVLPAAAWLMLELSGVGPSGALRQRLWLLLLFVWIELIAVRLFRLGLHVRGPVASAAV